MALRFDLSKDKDKINTMTKSQIRKMLKDTEISVSNFILLEKLTKEITSIINFSNAVKAMLSVLVIHNLTKLTKETNK